MNLPNKLTVIRILLIPLFMLVLLLPLDWGSIMVAGTSIPVTPFIGAVFLHVLQSRILLMVKLRDAISW